MFSKGLMVLTVVTAAAVAGCYWTMTTQHWSSDTREYDRELVAPSLHRQISEIHSIELLRSGAEFRLLRTDTGWKNQGLGGFPANAEKIESVLAELATLRYLEPRTERPSLFYRLDLDENHQKSDATRLRARNLNGTTLVDIVLGKSKGRTTPGGTQYTYVRTGNDQRVWLTEGDVDARFDAADWSARAIVDIEADAILSLRLRPTGSDPIELMRLTRADSSLELVSEIPVDHVAQKHQINYLAELFRDLHLIDARAVSESDVSTDFRIEASVETNNRLKVTMRAHEPEADGTVWAHVEASQITDARDSTSDASPPAEDIDETQRTVKYINDQFAGWYLLLPRTVGDRLNLQSNDMVTGN